jgi:phosphatidylglycerol---prolipoprotein diacylglyceryl transferase
MPIFAACCASFPSPIAFWLGSWPVHWYGLAYGFGALLAWGYGQWCLRRNLVSGVTSALFDGLVNISLMAIVIGGRLGHVLLYAPAYYAKNPLKILQVWEGGMAFHGAIVGMILALVLYARTRQAPLLPLMDLASCSAGPGLALGRLANFINQEVWGRPTDSPWGIVLPRVDLLPRHPSQLYEAFGEGILLFSFLAWGLWRKGWGRRPGLCSGIFALGYASVRMVCEFFRQPEGVWKGLTLGQWYSLPMVALGIFLILRAFKTPQGLLPAARNAP